MAQLRLSPLIPAFFISAVATAVFSVKDDTPTSWSKSETPMLPCHPDCKCSRSDPDKLKVFCGKGGLTDRTLRGLLNKLPKSTTTLRIVAPWFRTSNFTMTHEFLRFKRLQELHLVNCGLKTLGKRIFANLRHLHTLSVPDNQITAIYSETFENTPQIQHLNLARNRLQAGLLPTGAFSYLKRLRSLNLADNNISKFPQNLLFGLHNLDTLVLDGNRLNNSAVGQLLFDVPRLTRLTLNNCSLRDLRPEIFGPVPDIRSLELGFNGYGRVPVLPIKRLRNLTFLSLAGNNISIIPPYAFDGLPLKSISLAQNLIGTAYSPLAKNFTLQKSGIHPMAFANATPTHLDLSYNGYEIFHTKQLALAKPNLRSLDLSGNPLCAIKSEFIQDLRLESLHLADIRLYRLPRDHSINYVKLLVKSED